MIKIMKTEIICQWIKLKIWYYQSAIDHLDPLHPDVPEIVFKLMELRDQLKLQQSLRWKS